MLTFLCSESNLLDTSLSMISSESSPPCETTPSASFPTSVLRSVSIECSSLEDSDPPLGDVLSQDVPRGQTHDVVFLNQPRCKGSLSCSLVRFVNSGRGFLRTCTGLSEHDHSEQLALIFPGLFMVSSASGGKVRNGLLYGRRSRKGATLGQGVREKRTCSDGGQHGG